MPTIRPLGDRPFAVPEALTVIGVLIERALIRPGTPTAFRAFLTGTSSSAAFDVGGTGFR